MTHVLGALALLSTVGGVVAVPAGADWCSTGRITGYVRTEHGAYTADGTPIWADEAIAAAGYAIPMGSLVEVDGIGTFRVADRGMLGPTDVDIAVWTRAEAFALTSERRVCVTNPSR